MADSLLNALNTIWKFTRFIAKNNKAFRASNQFYAVRTNLSLANNEVNNAILPATIRPGAFANLIAIG